MKIFSGKRGTSKSFSAGVTRHTKELNKSLLVLIKRKLWLQIIIAMFLGVFVGVILGPTTNLVSSETAAMIGEWAALPGYFFLAIIQMIVVPLVFASVLIGLVAGGSLEELKKKGGWLTAYFLGTAAVAVVIGIVIGLIVQPGSHIDTSLLEQPKSDVELDLKQNESLSAEDLPKEIVSIIPSNPLKVMLDAQMLQVVIMSFILGFAVLSLSKEKTKPIIDLMKATQSVSMAIVKMIMHIAPLAVFGLLVKVVIKTGVEVLFSLGVYVLTVLGGLLILLMFLLFIALVVGKKDPARLLADMKEPLLMAFSTDSSAATMPLSIRTAQEKLKVKPSTAHFVIPIGATVNMSGTALYQGLATIFMAQIFGIHLPLTTLLILIFTAVGASIGTPATPGVGIIILASVLTSAGLPLVGIPLILGVDRILEMSRATLNVAGDLVACIILDKVVD